MGNREKMLLGDGYCTLCIAEIFTIVTYNRPKELLNQKSELFNFCLPSRLQRGKTPPPNECPGYGTTEYDGEVPVMLELWGMESIPSLPLLPGPLRPRVVPHDRALSMD